MLVFSISCINVIYVPSFDLNIFNFICAFGKSLRIKMKSLRLKN